MKITKYISLITLVLSIYNCQGNDGKKSSETLNNESLKLEVKAQKHRLGILDQKAPSWQVTEWMQLPDGKKSLDINDLNGKVVYLYCFQSWCPGCHSHGFPTLQKMIEYYENDQDVALVAIQTTFEGFYVNTFKKVNEIVKKYSLKIPIGQSGYENKPSQLMRSYRTGGTPWTIIIDKNGMVKYNDFHIEVKKAIKIIDHLKSR